VPPLYERTMGKGARAKCQGKACIDKADNKIWNRCSYHCALCEYDLCMDCAAVEFPNILLKDDGKDGGGKEAGKDGKVGGKDAINSKDGKDKEEKGKDAATPKNSGKDADKDAGKDKKETGKDKKSKNSKDGSPSDKKKKINSRDPLACIFDSDSASTSDVTSDNDGIDGPDGGDFENNNELNRQNSNLNLLDEDTEGNNFTSSEDEKPGVGGFTNQKLRKGKGKGKKGTGPGGNYINKEADARKKKLQSEFEKRYWKELGFAIKAGVIDDKPLTRMAKMAKEGKKLDAPDESIVAKMAKEGEELLI
jgi:hypothetical protein